PAILAAGGEAEAVTVNGLGFATGGEDGRIALWRGDAPEPMKVIEGHKGPVAALAVSPEGQHLASASWDGTIRVTSLADGAARTGPPWPRSSWAAAMSPKTSASSARAILIMRRSCPTTRPWQPRLLLLPYKKPSYEAQHRSIGLRPCLPSRSICAA
ncbi:MAG: hypothetical protein EOP19_16830, partial [Hyphomicrobiales bacterium]